MRRRSKWVPFAILRSSREEPGPLRLVGPWRTGIPHFPMVPFCSQLASERGLHSPFLLLWKQLCAGSICTSRSLRPWYYSPGPGTRPSCWACLHSDV